MSEIRSQVLIIGGGVAGITAAIWCSDLDLKARLVESSGDLGGQLHLINNRITNYPGVIAENGVSLLAQFERTMKLHSSFEISKGTIAEVDTEALTCIDAAGSVYSANAIILATGVRRRKLNVYGEDVFAGKGILSSGMKERSVVAGKNVAVVGGGDAAAENALILSEFAERVFLIHRGERLSARTEFVKAINSNRRIEKILNTTVTGFLGSERLSSIELDGDVRQNLKIDHAIVRIGVRPNSELVKTKLDLDARGYVLVDSEFGTSRENIYAIGDVANPVSPTIASAVGMAASATKSIAQTLSGR